MESEILKAIKFLCEGIINDCFNENTSTALAKAQTLHDLLKQEDERASEIRRKLPGRIIERK